MIEINLLPPELRTKYKKISVEARNFLYLIPVVLAVLICTHIYLLVIGVIKNYQFRALNNKWEKLAPQRKILEEFKKEHELLSTDTNTIQQLTSQRINWSEKLNKLSLNLPPGVWLNDIALTSRNFTLNGSAMSLEKKELSLINNFINNLKNDRAFFKDFRMLELSSVQRRVIGGYDVIDFVLAGALK